VRRQLRTRLLIGSVVAVAGAVTAAAIGLGDGPAPASGSGDPQLVTTPVTRTTLMQTQQVNGTLGYGTPVQIVGRGTGTTTWLPALGAIISRGQPVYEADNRSVPLFYGRLPLYRQLRSGDRGEDVKEVEENLVKLGYGGFTADTRYSSATAAAVRRWQKRLGLTQTGIFDPATVVVAPTVVRVTSLAGRLGDPATGPMLAYSGTVRTVSIALDVALQKLVKPGLRATVTLPDSKTLDGRITKVGTVATAAREQGDPATIEVVVAVSDQSGLSTFDLAPVAVTLVSATVKNVLTVPVAALVALTEGGYGLQLVTGSTSKYVAVRLGMFANGRVQVSGNGITEGAKVVTAS
jgi:peptidoglycan hydrolase-like protein with peptidoglycan-binding domain